MELDELEIDPALLKGVAAAMRGASHTLCTPPSSPSDMFFERTSLPIEFVDVALAIDGAPLHVSVFIIPC